MKLNSSVLFVSTPCSNNVREGLLNSSTRPLCKCSEKKTVGSITLGISPPKETKSGHMFDKETPPIGRPAG